MVSIKFYLDTRKSKSEEDLCSLRINLTKDGKASPIQTGIRLTQRQWDKKTGKVQNHPKATLYNHMLAQKMIDVEGMILKMEEEDDDLGSLTSTQIRDKVLAALNPEKVVQVHKDEEKETPDTFLKWYDRFTDRKQGRTKQLYKDTRNRLVAWLGEKPLSRVMFEDIKISWLEDFSDFLGMTERPNTVSIHLRNVRAVVNYAIDNEVTTQYAFRRFKMPSEKTAKRNFDVTVIRRIFWHTCEHEYMQKYLDFFKLSFLLIGINVVDLCDLEEMNGDYIEYLRAKTHRPYSIKVEPEAKKIIDQYRGETRLLNFAEHNANYRSFYGNLHKALREIRKELGLETLTTYWARHSWATIAYSIGVSKDVIAECLGHGGNTVTDIYIEGDKNNIDEANKKVIEWVLYGIKNGEQVVIPGSDEYFGKNIKKAPVKKVAVKKEKPSEKKASKDAAKKTAAKKTVKASVKKEEKPSSAKRGRPRKTA